MQRTDYNIYCDESRVENPDSRFMVIGAIFLPRKQKDRITKELKELFSKYNYHQELNYFRLGTVISYGKQVETKVEKQKNVGQIINALKEVFL